MPGLRSPVSHSRYAFLDSTAVIHEDVSLFFFLWNSKRGKIPRDRLPLQTIPRFIWHILNQIQKYSPAALPRKTRNYQETHTFIIRKTGLGLFDYPYFKNLHSELTSWIKPSSVSRGLKPYLKPEERHSICDGIYFTLQHLSPSPQRTYPLIQAHRPWGTWRWQNPQLWH